MSNDYKQSFTITFTNADTSLKPPDGWVSAVTIFAIKGTFSANTPYTVQYLISPTNASATEVEWYMVNQNGTDATIDKATGVVNASVAGSCYVKAVLLNADGIGGSIESSSVELTITNTGIDVSGIYIYNASTDAETDFEIGADVQPWNASYKDIVWTIKDAKGTGARIDSATGIFYADTETAENDPVIITATIYNGLVNSGQNFTTDFEITVYEVGSSLGTGAVINKTSGHVGYVYSDATLYPEDDDGTSTKAMFTIPFVSGTYYSVTAYDGYNAWKIRTPNDSLIVCKNPKIVNTNKTAMMLELDMVSSYPSNSPVTLVYGTDQAKLIMSNQTEADPFETNQMIGATGYTYSENYTDINGTTDKCLFVFRYTSMSSVEFTVNGGNNDWAVRLPDNSFVNLSNPTILRTNKDSTIVSFTMASNYPSNSPAVLCRRTESATYSYATGTTAITPAAGSLSGFMGYTSVYNMDNDTENADGEVSTFIANFIFSVQSYEPIFTLNGTWQVLMSNGELIDLTYDSNSIIFTNTDSVIVRFKMAKSFPSNVQGMLVYKTADSGYGMTAGSGEVTFVPVVQIDNMPSSIYTYTSVCLDYDVSIAPMNATNQTVTWEIDSSGNTAGATIDADTNILFATTVGKFKLKARIEDGLAVGTDYTAETWVSTEHGVITITSQPTPLTFVNYGAISGSLSVKATTSHSGASLSYQWYVNTANTNSNGTAITTAKSSTFTIPTTLAGDNVYYYYCEVTSSLGGSIVSDVAAVRCEIAATSMILSPSTVSLASNDTVLLVPSYSPSNATLTDLTWSSSDTSKATVDMYGNVTAGATGGSVTITATTSYGIKATATITVTSFIPVEELVGMTYSALIDTPLVLSPTVSPSNATYSDITWTMVNDYGNTVTLVDNVLTFTALDASSSAVCSIKATVVNGLAVGMNYNRSYTITLSTGFVAVTDLDLNRDDDIVANVPTKLLYEVTPFEATNKDVVWSLRSGDSNTIGATFSGDIITCKKAGTAWITATVANGTSMSGGDFVQSFEVTCVAGEDTDEDTVFIPITNMTLLSSRSSYKYKEIQLEVDISPDDAMYDYIVWNIDDASKANGATISSTGLLYTGAAEGEIIATATVSSMDVSVSNHTAITNIALNNSSFMADDTTVQLQAEITPSNATYSTMRWDIDDASKANGATISSTGLLYTGSNAKEIIVTIDVDI